jgi:uncharacterized membrane protein (UPF0136 family)
VTHRVGRTALVILALILAFATPASADPPGPTDFETVVTSIAPSTEAFEIEIIGGDSFVLLRHLDDSVVEVRGYNGEAYLRFLPGGIVEQNRLSPATYLNEERFGDFIPDFADAQAPPEWEQVDDDGSYAWHDHRAHLMTDPPINRGPGDQVTDQVIPVLVDGEEVDIAVASTWQTAPSSVPFAVGALAGMLATFAAWRRRSITSALLAIGGVIALVLGAVQYLSVPTETGPSLTLIALPLIALSVAIAASATRDRPATELPLAIGSATALIVFAALRLPDARKAILPTDLSMPLDRGLSAFVAVLGVGCVFAAGTSFARLVRAQPAS